MATAASRRVGVGVACIGHAGAWVLVLLVVGFSWDGFLGLACAGAVAGATGGARAEMETPLQRELINI